MRLTDETRTWRKEAEKHPSGQPCNGIHDATSDRRVVVLIDRIEKALALHPKIEEPRHGCCAPPKLCQGHKPECGGREHGMNRPTFPCPTVRALVGQ